MDIGWSTDELIEAEAGSMVKFNFEFDSEGRGK